MNIKKIIFFLSFIILMGVGCEREGTIKLSDCREQIYLEEDSASTFLKTFTCNYEKNIANKILSGECHRVVVNDGECRTVFSYYKKPQVHCSKKFPFADYDGKCYKEWDSGRINVSE